MKSTPIKVTFDFSPLIKAALEASAAFQRMAAAMVDPEESCPDCRYVFAYRHEGCDSCAEVKELLEMYRPEVMTDE